MKKGIRWVCAVLVLALLLSMSATGYATGYEPYLGEIGLYAFNFPPKGWAFAEGQLLSVAQDSTLFSLLGTTYGGDGTATFALPDLRQHTPDYSGSDYGLHYSMALTGFYPGTSGVDDGIISEVRLFPTSRYAGDAWVRCDGRLLSPAGNDTLFGLIGTWYGGDGESTFAIPDLSGFEPEGMGYYICRDGVFGIDYVEGFLGEMKLLAGEYRDVRNALPCNGQLLSITQNQALFSLLGTVYGGNGQTTFALPNTSAASGGGLANPFPGLQYYIYTGGIFPSRN